MDYILMLFDIMISFYQLMLSNLYIYIHTNDFPVKYVSGGV